MNARRKSNWLSFHLYGDCIESFQPSSLPLMWEHTNIKRGYLLNLMRFVIMAKRTANLITFRPSQKKAKARYFDVNRRSSYAMSRIGKGHKGLKRFLML